LKQITEIDDPRLVKALAHPLRIHILRILQDRTASPRELSEELDAKLPNVSYHVRALEALGLLELVRTEPRRGAIEHFYRARARLRVTGKAWAQVPDIVKNAMVAATLEQIWRYVEAGAKIGGFDRRDAHASRQPMVLDAKGFKDLGAALDDVLRRASEIEAESANRLAADGHKGEFSAGLAMMLFEAPPPRAGIPIKDAARPPHKTRRTTRSAGRKTGR
jgi:DNA-binding transcriptional ArsR family regulator